MTFKDVLARDENFIKLKNSLADTPLSVSGIAESCLAHFIYSIADNETALIVTSTDAQAKNLYFDLCFFSDAVLYFPTKEYIYYDIDAVSRFPEQKRIDVLEKIKSESGYITVTSYEALCQYTISPEVFSDCRIEIKNGTVLNIEKLSLLKGGTVHWIA